MHLVMANMKMETNSLFKILNHILIAKIRMILIKMDQYKLLILKKIFSKKCNIMQQYP